ncbi:tetratricopeptide repeat protein [Sutterella sp.]|uniref:tetratricopeptide repeat protein n=1 Tax=Sutterella sp. TaxID=1981025 RepID=UPI0026DF527C|nr:tetratricopeptide repeat protein [Sutterella sp.]MDO5530978.1 tetratricopeptide repeat protein [Sutterella sp.]
MLKSFILRTAAGAMIGAGLLTIASTPAAASVADGVAQIEAGKYAQAMKILKAEASRDEAEAFFYIGDMLNQGLGQKRAPLEATDWWEKGAYLGSVKCQLALSLAYRNGVGVKVNPRQALIWDREAAKQGSPVAFKNIGDYFATGNGQEIDTAEAAKWYYRAAAKGYPEGCLALAKLLADGEGVKHDLTAAWVLASAAANPAEGFEADRDAAAEARKLGHRLSASEMEAAKSMKLADVIARLAPLDTEAKR